jgi:hypothetical protein
MKCERCGAEYSGDICLHCLWRMHWGDKIHDEPPQQRRMERAQLIAKVDNLDAVKGSCTIKGSSSTPYITTLTSCTCTDFKRAFKRKHTIPCKHIYRLAHELGIIDLGKISNVVITFNEDKKHKIDSLQEDSQKELYALLTRWIYGLDTGSWIYSRDESSHRELLSKEILQEVDSPERLLVLVHIRDLRQVLGKKSIATYDDMRPPFGVYVEGDSMEEMDIPDGSVAYVNPAEEPQNGECALIVYRGQWSIKGVFINRDGSVTLRAGKPQYNLEIPADVAEDPMWFKIIGKVVEVKTSKKPKSFW